MLAMPLPNADIANVEVNPEGTFTLLVFVGNRVGCAGALCCEARAIRWPRHERPEKLYCVYPWLVSDSLIATVLS